MNFDKTFDLTAGVYLNFYTILHVVPITTHTHDRRKSIANNETKKRKEDNKEMKDKKAKNDKGKEIKEETKKTRNYKTRRGSKKRHTNRRTTKQIMAGSARSGLS